MDTREAKAIIEAILFSSPEPITLEALAETLDIDKETTSGLLASIKEDCQQEERGFQLVRVGGGYAFCTKEKYAEYVARFHSPSNKAGLTQAALETLAIVAYKQPVTRAEIDEIRGVSSSSAVNTLLERGLIQELGRREAPGRPIEYGTTTDFLLHFGIKDLGELPHWGEGELALEE